MKKYLFTLLIVFVLICTFSLVSCGLFGTTSTTTTTAHVHTEEIIPAVESTCTETGLTEGKRCSECYEIILAQEIVPASHTYGEPEIIKAADCFNEGEQNLACTLCDHEETQAINKVEHDFVLVENTELNKCSLCGAFEFDGNLYMIIDLDTTWTEAKEYCENRGGHLATITTKEEDDFIISLISMAAFNEYWIGGLKQDNVWTWVTGEEFAYTNWHPGEPNNTGGSEYYLQTWGTWNDTIHGGQHDNVTGIICEWEIEE